jgi:hypothetical protein
MGCQKGKESELVINMLAKAAYVERNKGCKYVWKVISVLCDHKLHPGKIFLEAEN